MKKCRIGPGFGLLCLLVAGCSSGQPSSEAGDLGPGAETASINAGVAKDIAVAVKDHLAKAFRSPTPAPESTGSTMLSPMMSIATRGEALAPTLLENADRRATALVDVRLPSRANGSFRVEDLASKVHLDVTLVGATDAPAEVVDGLVVHRGGYAGGADVLHYPTPSGNEDFVYFQKSLPEKSELRYRITLGDTVAGLRLIGDVLELLDAKGTPQLRMAKPYGVDAGGHFVSVGVSVEGCHYDTDTRPPWGRSTIDPGSRSCDVILRWEGGSVSAPLLIDPVWTETSKMTCNRVSHTMTPLIGAGTNVQGQYILIGGDSGGDGVTSSTEYYDHNQKKFSSGPGMAYPRSAHTATLLSDNRILVVGGRKNIQASSALPNVEMFNPANGSMVQVAALSQGILYHTAVAINKTITLAGGITVDSPVMIFGGRNSSGGVVKTAVVYNVTANTWTPVPTLDMKVARAQHSLTTLADGRILVAGGETQMAVQNGSKTVETLDLETLQWTLQTKLMAVNHIRHTATLIDDHKLLIAGGSVQPTSEIYDPTQDTWTTVPMKEVRYAHTATKLSNGVVLVAGGTVPNTSNILGTVELFRNDKMIWESADTMLYPRAGHTAGLIPTTQTGGKDVVLVAGGILNAQDVSPGEYTTTCSTDSDCSSDNQYCGSSGVCLVHRPNGATCDLSAGADCMEDKCNVCESGLCVDGYCCNAACDGQCEACDGAVPGKCSPVIGEPHGDKPACPAADSSLCAGSCNGFNTSQCTVPIGTQCDQKCADGTLAVYTCAPDATCKVSTLNSCSPYKCDETGTSCNPQCESNDDCVSGSSCQPLGDAGVMACNVVALGCNEDGDTVIDTGTQEPVEPCVAYKCSAGQCPTVCDTAYDCLKGFVCDANRKCIPTADVETSPNWNAGCKCTAPGQTESSSREHVLLALAAASILAARRKRAQA